MENRRRGKSKVTEAPEGPCFYKVICEQEGTLLKKRIPPEFMKRHGSKLQRVRYVNLVGPCGNQKVSLHHEDQDSGGNTYFHEQGWAEFRRTHSIVGRFEFLVFEYDGERTFNVSIFDGSGVMRSYDEMGSLDKRMSCPQSHGEKKKVQESTGIEIKGVKIEDEDSKDGIVGKNTIGTSKGRENVKEELAINLPNTNNPFSTICLKDSNVKTIFLLPIPKSFSNYFREERRAKMVLKNSEGKEWLVKAVKNNRTWAFSGGWKAFAKDNKLKEGDTCTIELVHQNMVHVHINRCG